jgi:NMT1/THI5 like
LLFGAAAAEHHVRLIGALGQRETDMAARFDLDRRTLLGRTGTLALASTWPGVPWLGVAWAQGSTPLSFQLSWLKSIQYGGYFAALENGAFKKQGIEATFNSGGPNVDPIANVASGQSGLGDRPIGPIIVAREKGITIKVIGTVFPLLHHEPRFEADTHAQGSAGQDDHGGDIRPSIDDQPDQGRRP